MDENYFGDQNWAVEAQVGVLAMLTFDDVVPVVTELNLRHLVASAKRTDATPPMAANPDLAVELILLAVAGAEALRKVAGLLAEDLYKGVRAGLLGLLRKARERDSSRPWNLGVTVGGQRFYFQGPRDDEELVRGLRALAAIVRDSPADLLDGTRTLPAEPGGGGWYWNAESGLWVPTPAVKDAMERTRGKG